MQLPSYVCITAVYRICSNFQMIKFTKIVAFQTFQINVYKNRWKSTIPCDQHDKKIYFRIVFEILSFKNYYVYSIYEHLPVAFS